MRTLIVSMEAFLGASCCGGSVSTDETVGIEVSDEAYIALKSIDENKVTNVAMKAALDSGNAILQSVHDEIMAAARVMIENYWIEQADYHYDTNEALRENIEEDLASGEFVPAFTLEQFIAKNGDISEYDVDNDYEYVEEDVDYIEDYGIEEAYYYLILNKYRDWVFEHDNDFIAKRLEIEFNIDLEKHDIEYEIDLCRE